MRNMFKIFCLLTFFISATTTVEAKTKMPIKKGRTSSAINFIEADWEKALKAAKETKKLVFVDIYATWCGPCKMLKKNTFTDKAVSDFFNENFVNVSIDGEKGVGPQLLEQYQVEAYPTLIIANAEGEPVLYTMGYLDSKTLLQFAKAALKKTGK